MKQVLVNKAPGSLTYELEELIKKELVEKAQLLLELLMASSTLETSELSFVEVRELRNGGVFSEMNSGEAATWLKESAHMPTFLQAFGASAVIKH